MRDEARADQARLVQTIMRRQAALSLRIAAVFVAILIGLPLLNLLAPDLMATPIGGFTLTWLLLAVLFYPVTWLLSYLFVRGSDNIEAAIVADYRQTSLPEPEATEAPAPTKRKLFVEEEEGS